MKAIFSIVLIFALINFGTGCADSDDCQWRGSCMRGVCLCLDGFAGDSCEDELYPSDGLLATSIMIGWSGADRFILGYYILGSLKLFAFLFAVIFGCLGDRIASRYKVYRDSDGATLPQYYDMEFLQHNTSIYSDYIKMKNRKEYLFVCYRIVFATSFLVVFSWWVCDWLLILTGNMYDVKGHPLDNSNHFT